MPSIYVRIPHYVASFLRNRDEKNPIPRTEPIQIEAGDELATVMQCHLMPGLSGSVNAGCFSERQWKSMCQGKVISYRKDSFALDISRPSRRPLSIAEILRLTDQADQVLVDSETGKDMSDEAYTYEYVPFQTPRTVVINGKEMRVQSDYNLSDTNDFVNILRRRFRRALVRFIALDREYVRSLGQNRSKMESMDRFLLRYDIRYNDAVREQMKKLMNRSKDAALEAFDADDDHGRWSREHINDMPAAHFTRQRTAVYCVTTDEHYPSVSAFARAHQLQAPNVFRALRLHHRIRGLEVRLEKVPDSSN